MPDNLTPTPPAEAKRKRWLPAALAVAIAVPTVIVAAYLASSTSDLRKAAVVPPAQDPSPAGPLSTRDQLLTIAGQLTSGPEDATKGRYEYSHLRRWMLTTTGKPAPRPMTTIVMSLDSRRWTAADGSGASIHIEPDDDYTLAGANPNYRSNDAEFTRAKPVTTRHPAREMAGSIQGTIPADPTALRRALDTVDPNPVTPKSLIIHIDELFDYRYVDLPARAAILRILADRTDLTYHETATDRMGRTGFAVSLDEDNLRYTLTFDRSTGQLLASEQLLIAPATDFDAPAGLIYYYSLYITSAREPTAP